MQIKRIFLVMICLILFSACSETTITNAPTSPPAATVPPAKISPTATSLPVVVASKVAISTRDLSKITLAYPQIYHTIQVPSNLSVMLDQQKLQLVTLPVDNQLKLDAADIQKAAIQYKNLDSYNFNRVATITTKAQIYAVPVKALEKYDFKSGVRAGLIYDKSGKLAGGGAYEVWLYEEFARLVDANGKVVYTWKLGDNFFYRQQEKPSDEPLVFFMEGSCWFCWNLGGRCGCLVCL